MIPLPEGISTDDIVQWLQGGICMVRSDTSFRPFITDRVNEEGLHGRFMDDDFRTTHTVPVQDARAYWPLMGSVNLEKFRCAVHVERRPERQYKRTFTHRLVEVTVPRAWDLSKVLGRDIALVRSPSLFVMRALYYPTYFDVDTALAMLGDGWMSVAINPRIIIAGDRAGKRMIYYRGDPAVSISGDVAQTLTDELTTLLIKQAIGGRYSWP